HPFFSFAGFSGGACIFNSWIAVVNLVFGARAFETLDGFRIFDWNKKVWVLALKTSIALLTISFEPF
ncbi:hypothetical protein MUO79_09440, partial [Candidatus Bathyarchaeota archaeon]|nr:hypothetical protein [Candidatus Bathyarchaeota archaeon]